MPLDIIASREFKSQTSYWNQKRDFHAKLKALDNELIAYHMIPKNNIELRIQKLYVLKTYTKTYIDSKKEKNHQPARRKEKITVVESLQSKSQLVIDYLKKILLAEQALPKYFGIQNSFSIHPTDAQEKEINIKNRWIDAAKQIHELKQHIGYQDDGRQIQQSYWSEAVDPLNRH